VEKKNKVERETTGIFALTPRKRTPRSAAAPLAAGNVSHESMRGYIFQLLRFREESAMLGRYAYIGIWVICLLFLSCTPAVAQRRTALVIGNNAYQNDPLRNPVNDATDMANTLRGLGFEVTMLRDADRRKMLEALETYNKELRKGGAGLFYFAGHGVQVGGENYLIPIGASINREQDVQHEAVSVGRVLGVMEDAGNELNIIILDARRNNPYARSFRSSSTGLSVVQAARGSLIVYATAPGTVAADGSGRNGLYTQYLLQTIKTSGLKVEEVFKKVRIDVTNKTRNTEKPQTPWESSSLIGDFYFVPQPPPGSVLAHGKLGITWNPVTLGIAQAVGLDREIGVQVGQVIKGGPAERGGIKPGDVITKIAGQEVKRIQAEELVVGKAVEVEVVRGGNRQRFSVVPAEMTEAEEQYSKGQKYEVSQDFHEAVEWYRKAAEQGLAQAQHSLGYMYAKGKGGLPKDAREAVKWYRKAAEQGDVNAQNSLGLMYAKGEGGLPKDPQAAVQWYRKAADQGDTDARKALEALRR
jgi:hypothetical protein